MKRQITMVLVVGGLSLVLFSGACSDDASGAPDAGVDAGDGGPCPGTPCPAGAICRAGLCVADHGPCDVDDDCINDTFCDGGRCIPYGPQTRTHDPGCRGRPGALFDAAQLQAPEVLCSWTADAVNVTPLVADLDQDGSAEIVFTTASGNLVALSGGSCQVKLDVAAGLYSSSHLAIGDLDGDGIPEIVGTDISGRVRVFDNTGTLIASSADYPNIFVSTHNYGGPSIANLDGVGPAEILSAGLALRLEGGQLATLYSEKIEGGSRGHVPVVVDVDLDGSPEVVIGNSIFDAATGADKTPAAVKSFPPGYAAVADFDPQTPGPEVALVSSRSGTPGEVRIYDPRTGALLLGPIEHSAELGGPPAIADVDGDGEPELGVAGTESYTLVDLECAGAARPSWCAADGVRWVKSIRDGSSGSAGSAMFDFNRDGAAEVVYRDECWLRVYDGASGTTRFAVSVTSGTWMEYPSVADVDGDGHAEILVSSSPVPTDCKAEAELGLAAEPPSSGVFVFRDPAARWAAARPVWNQHAYHITNINADLSVPASEPPIGQGWNSFRHNGSELTPPVVDGPDLTARPHREPDPRSDCSTVWVLQAELCNRGAAKVDGGVAGTFFRGDPDAGGVALCTAVTSGELAAGECETVSCDLAQPGAGAIDLWFVPDRAADGSGAHAECKERNNLMHAPDSACSAP